MREFNCFEEQADDRELGQADSAMLHGLLAEFRGDGFEFCDIHGPYRPRPRVDGDCGLCADEADAARLKSLQRFPWSIKPLANEEQ